MPIVPSENVAVVTSDLEIANVVVEVCHRLGMKHSCLTFQQCSAEISLSEAAIVLDGEPLSHGPSMLRCLRAAHPLVPIVAFPRMRVGAVPFLVEAGATLGVSATGYWSHASDAERLSSTLHCALRASPRIAVMRALEAILPTDDIFGPRTVAATVIRLRVGGSRVTYKSVAEGLGVSARALRRRWCHQAGTPKHFADEITLLLAVYARRWTGRGWERIAAEMGTTERALRRLRKGIPEHRQLAVEEVYRRLGESIGAGPEAIEAGMVFLLEPEH